MKQGVAFDIVMGNKCAAQTVSANLHYMQHTAKSVSIYLPTYICMYVFVRVYYCVCVCVSTEANNA